MKYLAAYCLAVLGGNASPSGDDLTKVLESVGVDVDSAKLDAVLKALEGKTLHEVINGIRFLMILGYQWRNGLSIKYFFRWRCWRRWWCQN